MICSKIQIALGFWWQMKTIFDMRPKPPLKFGKAAPRHLRMSNECQQLSSNWKKWQTHRSWKYQKLLCSFHLGVHVYDHLHIYTSPHMHSLQIKVSLFEISLKQNWFSKVISSWREFCANFTLTYVSGYQDLKFPTLVENLYELASMTFILCSWASRYKAILKILKVICQR